MCVIHWGLLLRLPWSTWVCPCEGQVWRWCSCWFSGVMAAPGTQWSWWLGQEEICFFRTVWQQVLASMLQYVCLENPPPWQRSLAGHSPQGRKESRHDWSNPARIDARYFFACGSSAPVRVECKGGGAAWLLGTLTAVCRDIDCLRCRNYDSVRVFFWTSCGWQSEDLFHQSFSIAPHIQALRGLPCLESFSAVRCIRHIEGPPGWGLTL